MCGQKAIVSGLFLAILLGLSGCSQKPSGAVVVTPESPQVRPTLTAEALLPMVDVDSATAERGETVASTSGSYPAPETSNDVGGAAYPEPGAPATPAGIAYPEPSTTEMPTAVPDLAGLRLQLDLVTPGLDKPVAIADAEDGSGRLFVVEKKGVIRIVRNDTLEATPFMDISDRVGSGASEQGLLGLAFHPAWPDNGYFFVNYTDRAGNTVVSRFFATARGEQGDPNSEVVILTQEQPAANHNGGNLVFGPDGYLYIGFGDGGAAGDLYGNGQNGQTWLGALLRIDVNRVPYRVPPDNPFVADPAVRDEIWAIGLRNPWRFSFDRATGDLFIADVGQDKYEEVDFQVAGGPGGQNYGWPLMEGNHCYPDDTASCNQDGLQVPIVEYDHGQGCSITGGYVYRGSRYPALQGIYLFADYCSGRLWGLVMTQVGDWQVAELAQTGLRISTFGQDESGELYLADVDKGELYHIVLP